MLADGELEADGTYGPAGARPIMQAVQFDLAEAEAVTDLLVEFGADLHGVDALGHSVLEYAVDSTNSLSVKARWLAVLMERGVGIDEPSIHGNTVLNVIAFKHPTDRELIEHLISLGADPDSCNKHGGSARHSLREYYFLEIRGGKLHDV